MGVVFRGHHGSGPLSERAGEGDRLKMNRQTKRPENQTNSAQPPGERRGRAIGVGGVVGNSDFWPGVWSVGPWLGGGRASRKARRGTRTARGQTDIGGGSEGELGATNARPVSLRIWRDKLALTPPGKSLPSLLNHRTAAERLPNTHRTASEQRVYTG